MQIRVRVHAAAAYRTDRAWKFGLAAPVLACKIDPKYFGPVYFQTAKLQIFLHFGPKI